MAIQVQGLNGFIAALRRLVEEAQEEAELLARVEPLVKGLALQRSWLRPAMYEADPALGYGTTLLHVEPDRSLFVVVDSWLPGRGVRPHDHDTWAVVAGIEGVERNTFWQRLDDASRPGYAELQRLGEQTIAAGETLRMPRGSIHSVVNEGPQTSLSLHVYGRHLNDTARRQFDPENRRELPFLIEPR
ncbi:cysteine dioxygenase family protein [Pseudomonas sp. CrR25]|nr:cysteine dioxygenase family protein [Pseudomonas sp. CrR25]